MLENFIMCNIENLLRYNVELADNPQMRDGEDSTPEHWNSFLQTKLERKHNEILEKCRTLKTIKSTIDSANAHIYNISKGLYQQKSIKKKENILA